MAAALFTGLALTASSQAALSLAYQFNGNGNWSIDGVGSNSAPVGNLEAFVPLGSVVEKAFLYSSATPGASLTSLNFDGTVLAAGAFTNLGSNNVGLTAFRADVTSQVAAKVGGGSGSRFTFSVLSETPNENLDGEVLAVIYSNPSESIRTIAFLDGFSQTTGDQFKINLANPLDTSVPGFQALFSLGIGFSAGGTQYSQVDVNGKRLTSSAGGYDDGILANGGLITAGGLDDSSANPTNPASTTAADDELYNLANGGFLADGITQITIDTLNPSADDNIFFAGINGTFVAGVNQPPPPPPTGGPAVPEPSTYGLLGALGLAGLIARRRFAKKA